MIVTEKKLLLELRLAGEQKLCVSTEWIVGLKRSRILISNALTFPEVQIFLTWWTEAFLFFMLKGPE